eukprot:GEMP01068639.1.p1 GENE.GEMP01068639.1~~GEMP01068639.1.p1  ORF type:complete len:233 (+),score=35.95 GEMP01068639.1:87-785(+)
MSDFNNIISWTLFQLFCCNMLIYCAWQHYLIRFEEDEIPSDFFSNLFRNYPPMPLAHIFIMACLTVTLALIDFDRATTSYGPLIYAVLVQGIICMNYLAIKSSVAAGLIVGAIYLTAGCVVIIILAFIASAMTEQAGLMAAFLFFVCSYVGGKWMQWTRIKPYYRPAETQIRLWATCVSKTTPMHAYITGIVFVSQALTAVDEYGLAFALVFYTISFSLLLGCCYVYAHEDL